MENLIIVSGPQSDSSCYLLRVHVELLPAHCHLLVSLHCFPRCHKKDQFGEAQQVDRLKQG